MDPILFASEHPTSGKTLKRSEVVAAQLAKRERIWSGSVTIAISSAALVTVSFLPLVPPAVGLSWLQAGALGLASSLGLSQRTDAAAVLLPSMGLPETGIFQIAILRGEDWFSTSAAYGRLEEAEQVVAALESRLGCQTKIIHLTNSDGPRLQT
ncbi:MAG: hypothetical protein DWQ34_00045 [Planctomycetota bacterium]|nr:MAG: hypothetical protein DWQ29_24540 [Planctomycetota bacterium]REJ98635.1 MAG: hypothetical protein DWQ34_00045 [Planctomycetota bacterium]REK26358.1 MAG: hypothetical protein DWQ41_10075 [Planctomycetota bacterium]